jgi:hypothetical protein
MSNAEYAEDIAAWIVMLADESRESPATKRFAAYVAEHIRQDIPSLVREHEDSLWTRTGELSNDEVGGAARKV